MNNSGKKKPNLTTLYSLSERWVNKPTLNKAIAAKHEDWTMRLKLILAEAEIIKTALQAKDKDVSALDASHKELDKKLKALMKEMEKAQKLFSKKRSEIQTKLLCVVDSVESSNGVLLQALKENCKKIAEGLEISKSYLNQDATKIDATQQLLKPMGQKIAKLLLPKNMEVCAEESKDLKERLEAIIRSTVDMTLEDAPAQFNPTSIKTALTVLRESCTNNVKLLELVAVNVKRVFKDTDEKESSKDAQNGAKVS